MGRLPFREETEVLPGESWQGSLQGATNHEPVDLDSTGLLDSLQQTAV